MTIQWSQPWDGKTEGDAALRAPYSATEWDDMFECMFGSQYDCGIIPGIGGELGFAVVSIPGEPDGFQMNTGAALVMGKFFRATAGSWIVVEPPAGATRRDRIVLRSCWVGTGTCANALHAGSGEVCGPKKIRICHKKNPVENLVAPALEQTDGIIWELPICTFDMTTAGVITIVEDERQFVYGPASDEFFYPEAFSGFTVNQATLDPNYNYWRFDPVTSENIVLYMRVPDQFRGLSFRIWIYWTGTAAPGANDQVVWLAPIRFYEEGEDTSTLIPHCVPNAVGVLPAADELVITELQGADCHLIAEPGDMMLFWISRDTTNPENTYASDACLFGVRLKMY